MTNPFHGSLHLCGIAGTGMSALAEALRDAGAALSGSDRFLDGDMTVPALEALRSQGVALFAQDGSGVRAGETLRVVASAAVEADNPDLQAARRLGLPVRGRAEELAALFRASGRKLVAVAGTSGKSTTTALLGHLLEQAGMSPCVVGGAPCLNWARPGRTGAVLAGTGPLCIAEADESNRQFLAFSPYAAIILNESADHFPLPETHALFDEFAAKVAPGPLLDLRGAPPPDNVEEGDWSVSFELDGDRLSLPLPGAHNAADAAAACRMALALGAPRATLAPALASFRGLARRMQLVGVRNDGFRVVDDYAHNTEKIRAALLAMKKRSERLFAIWRPHGYGPLRAMSAALAAMFAETLRPADQLLLLPVFDAGGTADRRFGSSEFAEELRKAGVPVRLVQDGAEAALAVRAQARGRDAAITLGARDPALPALAQSLLS